MTEKIPFLTSPFIFAKEKHHNPTFQFRYTLGIFLLLLFSFTTASAKTLLCFGDEEIDKLMDQAISFNNNGKSNEAIEILQKIVKKTQSIGCEKGELAATKNIMLIYSQTYDYKKALEISNSVRDLAISQKNYRTLSTLYGTRATLYEALGLNNESLKEYKTALTYAKMISDADIRHYEIAFIYYNMTPYYQGRDDHKVLYYLGKSREEIRKIKDYSKEVSAGKKTDMLISVDMNLGIFYRDSKNRNRDIELSESYLMEALKQLNNVKEEISPDTKIDLYQALQELYQLKKDYGKAIEYGESMLVLEKSNSMPYNRRAGYMVLAKSYLGTGDSKTSEKYLDLFTKLNDSITSAEKEAVEVPVKKIISETRTDSEKIIRKTIILSISILIMILAGTLWYRKRANDNLHKKYEELITQISTGQKNISEEPVEIKENAEVKPAVNITDETVKVLLARLEKFELSEKYLRKDLSLTWMANNLNTNTKYLSEIIKTYRDKNFTGYINGLRIGYITKKLYEDPIYREYKINYLAEECGYTTPRVFVTAFKNETGFTPSYFVEQLRTTA